jgi:hypothetical protein
VLLVCGQMHMLLHDGLDDVVLQVEQVLRILGHRSHTEAEVGALEVGHSLKAPLSHGVLLIANQEKHDRHHGGSGEASLTQGGECDMCHLLDGSVGLAVDDGSHPWRRRVEGYCHTDFTHI